MVAALLFATALAPPALLATAQSGGHSLQWARSALVSGALVPGGGPPAATDHVFGDHLGEGEAFLSSLVVPGLAQHRQGNRRWIAYAGLEVLSAALFLGARADALSLRSDYRDFAWAAARAGFSAEPRRDGDFDYYERLSNWDTSGRWDVDPVVNGLQPESDPLTYNGSVWLLAMQIFNVDPAAPERSPGYGRAMDYYREHGYGSAYLWVWREGTDDRSHFSELIARSDGRFKDARNAFWLLVANHVLSSLDGFVTARLQALPRTDAIGVSVSLPVR